MDVHDPNLMAIVQLLSKDQPPLESDPPKSNKDIIVASVAFAIFVLALVGLWLVFSGAISTFQHLGGQ